MEKAVQSEQVIRVAGAESSMPRPGFRGLNPGHRWLWLLGAAILSLTGCVTTGQSCWPWHDGPPRGQAAQVVAIWADGVVVQPDPMRGGLPTPGLAGRVYLFGPELGHPVAAEGCLSVFLYDETPAENGQSVPREVWNIDAANLQRISKKDGLGWGYNLWLPWNTYQQDVKKVKLTVLYKPEQGQEVWSSTSPLTVGGPTGLKPPSQLQATTHHVGRPAAQ